MGSSKGETQSPEGKEAQIMKKTFAKIEKMMEEYYFSFRKGRS